MRMLESEGAAVEQLEVRAVRDQLRPETMLVSMDAVNSETGERFDTLAMRRALDAYRPGILLHVDASQAPFTLSCKLAHRGADLLTLDAQKIGGVRGIGALLVRSSIPLAPLMQGGGQEEGRRPGTAAPALASAFAAAFAEAQRSLDACTVRSSAVRSAFLERCAGIPRLAVNEGSENVPHILNLSLVGRDTDYLVALLDQKGFAVSTKSACESDSSEGSRAVLALTGDPERAQSTLRISWGPTTNERELIRFADALARAVRFLDENAI
jgi:cysteine desulfurase